MTEQEYTGIAAACDRILRAEGTSVARLAIPMLHVINEHPSCISTFESALDPERPRRGMRLLSEWEDSPRAVLRAGRAVLQACLRGTGPQTGTAGAHQVDVLIVSHLVNASQLDSEGDFYFGPLQSLIREDGATSVLAFVNHLPSLSSRAATDPTRLILPDLAPPEVEAKLWHQCLRARNQLRSAARGPDSVMDGTVARMAARHAWLAPAVANLRLHWSLSELCKVLNPRVVLTTYEGESCERVIWHAARTGGRQPLCVGYQHTRLLPRSHAIRRRLGIPGLDCDPDVVLTLGDIPHETLARSPGITGIKLIRYGSHRRPTKISAIPPQQRPQRCLVLPDADPGECATLFLFAIEAAERLPSLTFVLRPHPSTQRDALALLIPRLRNLPPNVELSTGTTLEEDCALARYCLYRGSSAVMQAVITGVRPFYAASANELPFDILAGFFGWHETVSSPEEFVAKLQAPDADDDDPAAARETIEFCQSYTCQLQPSALQEVLRLAGQLTPTQVS